MQIFAWGSTFYLPAILAPSIAEETGWPLVWIIGSLSIGLIVAGLVSPTVGNRIDKKGGRWVLTLSCALLSIGLVITGLSTSLWMYFAGWLILGIGMGSGLYDAAFATLAQIYGLKARSAITTLTLWGGFSSTVCWPLSVWMLGLFGWRATCLIYAGILLLVCLPLIRKVLPARVRIANRPRVNSKKTPLQLSDLERKQMRLLSCSLMIAGAIGALVSVHLLLVLSGRGLSIEQMVALGALIGPAQVAGRLLEAANKERHHALWTLTVSVSLTAVGLLLLATGFELTAWAIILYGAGNGIFSIAKGAMPLFLFGSDRYARIMGRLALPSLLAQALVPALVAWLLAGFGPLPTLVLLAALGLANIVVVVLIWRTRLQYAPSATDRNTGA
ncbi:MAG: MFS transporter [Pseudohongiella sp.]|nr:MFS transporter [Pseudohongiella sp.]MDP2127255.1 MFS transporter [Pseudohongiella sp.]